jgi:hypothetical protein
MELGLTRNGKFELIPLKIGVDSASNRILLGAKGGRGLRLSTVICEMIV